MNRAKEFKTLGPITDPEKQIYIERPEDTEVLQAVYRGDYVTLLGTRQTGKTSLLYKLARELKTEIPVFVDLSSFSEVKKDDWYDRVARTVVGRLPQGLKDAIGEVNFCIDNEQFRNLLQEIADTLVGPDRLILLLDEVGTVPKEIRDGFFSTIRSIYNEIGTVDAFQKYIFVLAGATPTAELISPESENSPFNISKTIYMSDFSLKGVRKLGKNLRLHGFTIDNSVIEHIHNWTHGHPNLTQEIFSNLVKSEEKTISDKMVDKIVQSLIVRGCNNLEHIRRHLDREENENVRQAVIEILKKQFKSKFTRTERTDGSLIIKMELIGLIRKGEDGSVVIHNRIYEEMLKSKKGVGEFDVFLAHNSKDKPQVEAISKELKRRGIRPWLDKEQIPPGRWFQDIIQQAIPKVKSAAIFIGPKGLGKWQVLELRTFISRCVEENIPVIPVLLPGVTGVPPELLFLKELSWVCFVKSIDETEALDNLDWGITGKHPRRTP